MALMLQQKKAVVNKLADIASASASVIATNFQGLKSNDITDLRSKLRSLGNCNLRVIRNTLAKKAFIGTNCEKLIAQMKGPLMLAFIQDEPSLVAKLLKDFLKDKEKLSVAGLLIEGQLLSTNQLDYVASLPTKQEALTLLVKVIQAPILRLVQTLSEPVAKLVRVVAVIKQS